MALKYMLKISNESDMEHLHKFRVALRKSRALLKFYMKDAYALQEVLKIISQRTNVLRELDVLLMKLEEEKKLKRVNIFKTTWEPFKTALFNAKDSI